MTKSVVEDAGFAFELFDRNSGSIGVARLRVTNFGKTAFEFVIKKWISKMFNIFTLKLPQIRFLSSFCGLLNNPSKVVPYIF